jgi:hypothetical protein
MKLTNSQLRDHVKQMWATQGQKCRLCKLPLVFDANCVGDHCHKTGKLRGAVHRRCNSLLGKLENNAPRFGFGAPGQLEAFLYGVGDYLRTATSPYIHPLHKTPEEKRLLRNKKAVIRRAQAKVSK